jgi:hypothetical protein
MNDVEYFNRATYNHEFYVLLTEKFPNYFFDWKIVAMFYCAIHCLKAYCLKNHGIYIGNTHYEIIKNVSHKSSDRIVDLPSGMWDEYYALYQYSKNARYEGITDIRIFELLMKEDFRHASLHLTRLKLYLKSGEIIIK